MARVSTLRDASRQPQHSENSRTPGMKKAPEKDPHRAEIPGNSFRQPSPPENARHTPKTPCGAIANR